MCHATSLIATYVHSQAIAVVAVRVDRNLGYCSKNGTAPQLNTALQILLTNREVRMLYVVHSMYSIGTGLYRYQVPVLFQVCTVYYIPVVPGYR
jgi:hypothetical protein